ncbi:MAG: isocitrate lyase/phosphoenolpyruvate mutase family protein, partial [Alphaproteobacteria bacterium]|nr:isocitrate lyase/phosphoenolpyruvate mutase family protein [Alphaproteobacteria bacterium]
AHYHKYVAHAVPLPEFVDKIKWACRERDRVDRDFVIIARSDTCREFGLDEAIGRVNAAAEVGADLGLVFPRNNSEAETAPKRSKLPLIWVQSRGNRDGRPIYSLAELQAMGYRACIDAQLLLGVAVHFMKEALGEMLQTGQYTRIGDNQFTALRKDIEDMIGLDSYYDVEAETVEKDQAEAGSRH